MASETDICNLALGHLGDAANLQSISPPDGSAQADHCARFYPIARDALLEMHDWAFATKRVSLALLTVKCSEWLYAYAAPADMLNPLAVMDPTAPDDTSAGIQTGYFNMNYSVPVPQFERGIYTPQPFTQEAAPDGTTVIWTNQCNAVLRYLARVTDTSKFETLFITSLSWYLASMLAGPVLKGDSGVKAAGTCLKMLEIELGRATTSDANQKRSTSRDRHAVPWMNGR
jgi:hypothetical protein